MNAHMTGSSQADSVYWNRRTWLTTMVAEFGVFEITKRLRPYRSSHLRKKFSRRITRITGQSALLDPQPKLALVQQAVDNALAAGATYADAHMTRTVQHGYNFAGSPGGNFLFDIEVVGIGIRTLVDGYWGFVASAKPDSDTVARMARDAVAQSRVNAAGGRRPVEWAGAPAVKGEWSTPVRIDPFSVSIEEKFDAIAAWSDYAWQALLRVDPIGSNLRFARQEQFLATSEGTLIAQTRYESGGIIILYDRNLQSSAPPQHIDRIGTSGSGWELFLDAHIREQMKGLRAKMMAEAKDTVKPAPVGRYTMVLDGVTMASLVERTFGIATQLDRALGYEADAGGTSFIDDPLAMVGQLNIASPLVTVTANRTVPTYLATVRWDDEGVNPSPYTLIDHGVLVDFQTTREQAGWLTPYYRHRQRPIQSHGCAAAEDAIYVTMQHMPNLTLEAGSSHIHIEDMIADVKDGIYLENGSVLQIDAQARNGLLIAGGMHSIKNGKLDRKMGGNAVQFNTEALWKHIRTIGGPSTTGTVARSQFNGPSTLFFPPVVVKGQPPQSTSHTVQAVAATIPDLPLINPGRKA